MTMQWLSRFLPSSRKATKTEETLPEEPPQALEGFVKAMQEFKKLDPVDIPSDEDLFFAATHMISAEEHLIMSFEKTGHSEYRDLIPTIREIRKSLMKTLVPSPEGEVWCLSKHFLSATMRLMECGSKQTSLGHKTEAQQFFEQAYHVYCLFWAINRKDCSWKDLLAESHPWHASSNWLSKLGERVKAMVNCCLE